MQLVYEISIEKQQWVLNSLSHLFLWLFNDSNFLHFREVQWCLVAMAVLKKLFQIHHQCSFLPVEFFFLGIGDHEGQGPDPFIADVKCRVFTPHECKLWTFTWAKILSLSTPPGDISVFTGVRQTANHWQILWRKGLSSQPFPCCSPPLRCIT